MPSGSTTKNLARVMTACMCILYVCPHTHTQIDKREERERDRVRERERERHRLVGDAVGREVSLCTSTITEGCA